MNPRARKYVWDALNALNEIREFVSGKTLVEYLHDPLLRSAVERQIIIIGEALTRLFREAPEATSRIKDIRKIIGLRNVLAHEYDKVENLTIWRIVNEELDEFAASLEKMLKE